MWICEYHFINRRIGNPRIPIFTRADNVGSAEVLPCQLRIRDMSTKHSTGHGLVLILLGGGVQVTASTITLAECVYRDVSISELVVAETSW